MLDWEAGLPLLQETAVQAARFRMAVQPAAREFPTQVLEFQTAVLAVWAETSLDFLLREVQRAQHRVDRAQ